MFSADGEFIEFFEPVRLDKPVEVRSVHYHSDLGVMLINLSAVMIAFV